MGFYLLACPFKPAALLLRSRLHSLSLSFYHFLLPYLQSDFLLLYILSDSTPFLPGHLFITSVVGGKGLGGANPKRSDLCPWGWGSLSPYKEIFTKGINYNYYNFGTKEFGVLMGKFFTVWSSTPKSMASQRGTKIRVWWLKSATLI